MGGGQPSKHTSFLLQHTRSFFDPAAAAAAATAAVALSAGLKLHLPPFLSLTPENRNSERLQSWFASVRRSV